MDNGTFSDDSLLSDLWISKERKRLENLKPDEFCTKDHIDWYWKRLEVREDELIKARQEYINSEQIKNKEKIISRYKTGNRRSDVQSLISAQLMGIDPVIAGGINTDVGRWAKTGNPDWLDLALIKCNTYGIEIPRKLVDELSKEPERRIKAKAGVTKTIVKEFSYLWIFKLINFCKLTQEKAVERAAMGIAKYFPESFHLKSSTLDKYYSKWAHDKNRAKLLSKKLAEPQQFPNGWTIEEQNQFLQYFQELPEHHDLKGYRR